jgi:hypothetical protein
MPSEAEEAGPRAEVKEAGPQAEEFEAPYVDVRFIFDPDSQLTNSIPTASLPRARRASSGSSGCPGSCRMRAAGRAASSLR